VPSAPPRLPRRCRPAPERPGLDAGAFNAEPGVVEAADARLIEADAGIVMDGGGHGGFRRQIRGADGARGCR
jgi:hypothetical protein